MSDVRALSEEELELLIEQKVLEILGDPASTTDEDLLRRFSER